MIDNVVINACALSIITAMADVPRDRLMAAHMIIRLDLDKYVYTVNFDFKITLKINFVLGTLFVSNMCNLVTISRRFKFIYCWLNFSNSILASISSSVITFPAQHLFPESISLCMFDISCCCQETALRYIHLLMLHTYGQSAVSSVKLFIKYFTPLAVLYCLLIHLQIYCYLLQTVNNLTTNSILHN